MTKFYFVFPNLKDYVIITANDEKTAIAVFELMYHKKYSALYKDQFTPPFGMELFEQITQRQTD